MEPPIELSPLNEIGGLEADLFRVKKRRGTNDGGNYQLR
jgi:hypothetical protein